MSSSHIALNAMYIPVNLKFISPSHTLLLKFKPISPAPHSAFHLGCLLFIHVYMPHSELMMLFPRIFTQISWIPISMDAISIFQFAQAKNLESFMILLLCSCPPSSILGSSWLCLQTISRRWLFHHFLCYRCGLGTIISPAWINIRASSNTFCFYYCPTASRMSLASHIPFLASSSTLLVHFISATLAIPQTCHDFFCLCSGFSLCLECSSPEILDNSLTSFQIFG